MRLLLKSLPVVVLLVAAVDTVLVRRGLAHRPVAAALYGESVLIWLCFGLLALLPALLTARLLARRAARSATRSATRSASMPPWSCSALALLCWTIVPVLAHAVLERYTSVGADVSGLARARPWFEVAGVVLALALFAWLLVAPLARVPGRIAAAVVTVPALLAGLCLPGSFDGDLRAGATAPAGAPNLLLLVWDTARAFSLSPWGYERETAPHLARFAEDALLFEEARSVSCFTLTSHVSMLTGTYPSHHGARLTRMTYDPRATPSIARILRAAGYRTGGFVGTGVLRARTGMADGFETYDDRVDPRVCDTRAWKLVHDVQVVLAKLVPALRGNGNPHWIEDFQRPADEVLDAALAWIALDDPRPWFCLVNLYDVHLPYLPGADGRARFVRPYDGPIDGYLFRSDAYERAPGVPYGARLTMEDERHLSDLYDAEMWALDERVGRFLAEPVVAGGHTAVLITSDHGEAFGEGGVYEHNDITEPQVRVPFLLKLPSSDARAVGRVPGRVSGVDVAPTLLALAGVPAPEHMTGLALTAEPPPEGRVVIVEDRDKLSQAHAHYAVYDGRWKLVRTGVGATARFSLFDLEADPGGLVDVAPEHPGPVDELAELLTRTQSAWGGEREGWRAAPGAAAHLKALGYGGASREEE